MKIIDGGVAPLKALWQTVSTAVYARISQKGSKPYFQ